MTNNNHPITPPLELVQQWAMNATLSFPEDERIETDIVRDRMIAKIAAQWGADQELEACCEWLRDDCLYETRVRHLRAARRPKPPSLKAQAFEVLDDIDAQLDAVHYNILRRALEQLDD